MSLRQHGDHCGQHVLLANGYYSGWYGGADLTAINLAIVTGNTFSGNAGVDYGGGGAYFSGNTYQHFNGQHL